MSDGFQTTEERAHHCANQPRNVLIERDASYFGNEGCWVLILSRTATEDDLEENQHLEQVGDDIWRTLVEISHCPYCGGFLGNRVGKEAQMAHVDYSSWHAKQC